MTADRMTDDARPGDAESLAELLQRAFREHPDLTQRAVASQAGISFVTLSTWVNGTRGTSGRIESDKLRSLANALPREFTVERVFKAAGRRTRGPIDKERTSKLLENFGELTEREQRAVIEMVELLRRPS